LCIAAGTVDLGGWSIAFPKLSLVVEFIVMAVVLLIRPWGLLGRAPAYAIATTLPEQRALVIAPGRRSLIAAAIVACAAAVMPLLHHPYALVLGTDILVAALFAASLQIITGTAGMTSFGHAAFFGLGAYGAALALRGGWPFAVALASGVALAAIAACVLALLVVRLSGVYLAMLTLAFAQILWSIALQWDDVTGGSNGIVGVWPPAMLASRHAYYVFVLALAGVGLVALVRIAFAPFGRSLRAARDAPVRAAALGIPVARRRAQALAISGAFAGLAGALYVFAKGSVSPDALSIPRSVDVLVMMLLGGLNAVFGPLLGAATFVWLQDSLARWTEYWRACVGAGILILVLAFPGGLGGAIERARVARAVERP